MESVLWNDAADFCNRLSQRQGLTLAYHLDRDSQAPKHQDEDDDVKWTVSLIEQAKGYCLPTEAEWEYAARGGAYAQTYPLAGSPNLHEIAHWVPNSHDISQPVGLKAPNPLGLFDLNGNVYEWCWDWLSDQYPEADLVLINPRGPAAGRYRVVRGGACNSIHAADL